MDSFVKATIGDKAPEERTLEVFRETIAAVNPSEWPKWVTDLVDAAAMKRQSDCLVEVPRT